MLQVQVGKVLSCDVAGCPDSAVLMTVEDLEEHHLQEHCRAGLAAAGGATAADDQLPPSALLMSDQDPDQELKNSMARYKQANRIEKGIIPVRALTTCFCGDVLGCSRTRGHW